MRVCDLPEVLLEEIFSKVPFTSLRAVRSTCKSWNALTKNQLLAKTRNQSLGFMVINNRLFSAKFDLRGEEGDLICLSTKAVSRHNYDDIYRVFHCDGLLLCVIRDNRSRVVWNPYLDDFPRWVEPIHKDHRFHKSDMFAFGHDNNRNRNHKILRFLDVLEISGSGLPEFFEIYDFNSNSWRVLDVNPNCVLRTGVSLKGNTYFVAREKTRNDYYHVEVFLLCFDFTKEKFGPRLPLPFDSYLRICEHETLSCVRDEHLAVLYQRCDSVEIWITTKIEPSTVSWSSFLIVDLKPFPERFYAGSLFIDEEKKVALVVDTHGSQQTNTSCYQRACIVGQDGYIKSVKFGEAPIRDNCGHYNPLLLSSYVPSLVHTEVNLRRKRKRRDYY